MINYYQQSPPKTNNNILNTHSIMLIFNGPFAISQRIRRYTIMSVVITATAVIGPKYPSTVYSYMIHEYIASTPSARRYRIRLIINFATGFLYLKNYCRPPANAVLFNSWGFFTTVHS